MRKSYLLPVLSVIGVVGTAFFGIKAGPKIKEIKDTYNEDKDKSKAIITGAKTLAPTALCVAGTVACIVGYHAISLKQIAALSSAGALSANKLKKYRGKVKELFGEDADDKVIAEMANEDWQISPAIPGSSYENEEKELFYDEFSDRLFYSTTERVQQAMYHLNRNMSLKYDVFLSEWYDFLGINQTDESKVLFWDACGMVEAGFESGWIDFDCRECKLSNGQTAKAIRFSIDPMFEKQWEEWWSV